MSISTHDLRGAVKAAAKRMKRAPADERSEAMKTYCKAAGRLHRTIAERAHPEAVNVTVADWTSWEQAEPMTECPHTSWHREAVVKAVRAGGYAFCGNAHQNEERCVPVFSDGTVFTVSMRTWGGVMADAHGETGEMDYCRWAWGLPDGVSEVLP